MYPYLCLLHAGDGFGVCLGDPPPARSSRRTSPARGSLVSHLAKQMHHAETETLPWNERCLAVLRHAAWEE
eukprot:2917051-Amphidinium_carterae.1